MLIYVFLVYKKGCGFLTILLFYIMPLLEVTTLLLFSCFLAFFQFLCKLCTAFQYYVNMHHMCFVSNQLIQSVHSN